MVCYCAHSERSQKGMSSPCIDFVQSPFPKFTMTSRLNPITTQIYGLYFVRGGGHSASKVLIALELKKKLVF